MRSTEYLDHLTRVAGHGFQQALGALTQCAELGLPAAALSEILRPLHSQRSQVDAAFTRLLAQLDDERRRAEQPRGDPLLASRRPPR
jgi:hypothetical protein